MASKYDLVMWTKNGASTIGLVLKQISKVIPIECINKRIIVDDRSTDCTREIAESFGWQVILNDGNGISDGANTALRQVESDFFVSFEQDLVLANDWWERIPKYLDHPKVAVASGVRLPNQPQVVRKIQEFSLERNRRVTGAAETFLYGKTLDNTIYKTNVIRNLGGFPRTNVSAGVDNILAQKLQISNFEWKVDYDVRSVHLRKSLKEELVHYYWYGTCFSDLNRLLFNENVRLKPMIVRIFFSPLRGFQIAVEKRAPEALYVYPLMRFIMLKGISDGLRNR